jgi:lipopolysaccharide export LptBFGC system permease protein LptF
VFELESTDHDGPSAGLQKGYNELTFTELRREIARFSTEGDFRGVRQAIFSFHLRFSLAAATLVLAGFLLAAPVSHRALRGFLAFLTCFVYWVLLYTGEVLSVHQIAIPGGAGAWLPNIVLAAATLIIVSSRSSRLRGSLRPAP